MCIRDSLCGGTVDNNQINHSHPPMHELIPTTPAIAVATAITTFKIVLQKMCIRDRVSSYTTRHTWATLAKYCNFSEQLICEMCIRDRTIHYRASLPAADWIQFATLNLKKEVINGSGEKVHDIVRLFDYMHRYNYP